MLSPIEEITLQKLLAKKTLHIAADKWIWLYWRRNLWGNINLRYFHCGRISLKVERCTGSIELVWKAVEKKAASERARLSHINLDALLLSRHPSHAVRLSCLGVSASLRIYGRRLMTHKKKHPSMRRLIVSSHDMAQKSSTNKSVACAASGLSHKHGLIELCRWIRK